MLLLETFMSLNLEALLKNELHMLNEKAISDRQIDVQLLCNKLTYKMLTLRKTRVLCKGYPRNILLSD